jgi:hypothetical protein
MSFTLSYCPKGEQILDRLRLLYQKRSQQVILAKMNTPSRALAEFAGKNPAGFCTYPDIQERIEFWDAYTREHIHIYDDSIPTPPHICLKWTRDCMAACSAAMPGSYATPTPAGFHPWFHPY